MEAISMYTNINNVETIRAIDRILQTPKVNLQTKSEEMFSKTEKRAAFYDRPALLKADYEEMIEEASAALKAVNTELSFRMHEGTGRPFIQLVELETNEVIREIPPEKMLDILAGIWEWAGIIVDRKE